MNDSHKVRSLSAMLGAIPFACSPQSDQALNKVSSLSAMCGAIPFVCSPQNDQALNKVRPLSAMCGVILLSVVHKMTKL